MAFLKTPGHGFTPMGCLWAPVWGNSGPFRLGAFGPCAAAPWGPVEGGPYPGFGRPCLYGRSVLAPSLFFFGPNGGGGPSLHWSLHTVRHPGWLWEEAPGRPQVTNTSKEKGASLGKKGASPMAKGDSWRGGSGF